MNTVLTAQQGDFAIVIGGDFEGDPVGGPCRFRPGRDDLPSYHAVRYGVKRRENGLKENPVQARLVREAIPSGFVNFSRSAPQGEFMTLQETRSLAHLRPAQVRSVRDGLGDRRLPGMERTRSQFNPAKVLASAVGYRDSRRLERLTFVLKLPTYAIEQLICSGLLDEEDDKFVRLARGGTWVTADALDTLVASIQRTRSQGTLPMSAVALGTVARRIGGRHSDFIFQQTYAKWQAAEVLNVQARRIQAMVADDVLIFKRVVAVTVQNGEMSSTLQAGCAPSPSCPRTPDGRMIMLVTKASG